jgi:hypothetical protein
MIKEWSSIVELNWDASNCEEFKVKANTESKAHARIKKAVKKKYPNIGSRFHIIELKLETSKSIGGKENVLD